MLVALVSRPYIADREALFDQACGLMLGMARSEKAVSLCELASAAPKRRPRLLRAAFAELCKLEYSTGLTPAVISFVRAAEIGRAHV